MVLDQAGAFSRGPIEIHGGDGSPAAIVKAKTGRYRGRAFRALPEQLRTRYFDEDGDGFVPRPELRARVASWNIVNLMALESVAGSLADCHVVFCRNAFIYFSARSVAKVAAMLAELMPTPAYLCVGASESLLNVTAHFALEDVGGAFMYVKR
jgi:chemotaxis protein methyltransferase CheR